MPQTFIVVQQPDGSLKNVEAFNFLDANGNTVFVPTAILVDDAGVELAGQKSKATSTIVMPAVAGGRWYATVHYSARAAG